MVRKLFLVSITLIVATASQAADISMHPKNPKRQTTLPPAPNLAGEYGEVKFNTKDAKPISTTFSEEDIIIKTTVTEVCPKKGCWMKVKGVTSSEQVRVTFKDYGFFVPAELIGKEIAMQGRFEKHIESVDEQKHLLQDAKRPQIEIDAVTEPKENLRFVASGVKDLSSKK